MKSTELNIPGVKVIEPGCNEDFTGWTYSAYSVRSYEQIGIYDNFVQENHGYAFKDGCFRGIHCQESPFTQSYLMQCINGAMLDFAVDLRKDSPTYKQWTSIVLSANNRKLLYIPKGCAHACLTLRPDCEFTMKVNSYYEPLAFKCISYRSPELRIEMPLSNLIISDQDKTAMLLETSRLNLDDKNCEQYVTAQYKNDLSVTNLELAGLKVIEPKYYEDFRGFFAESFSERKLRDFEINTTFVQDNYNYSHSKGTFHGIYCQNNPHAQGKLIRCTRGAIMYFAIDLRRDSPTFKRWNYVILSSENHKQLWIPCGFGHAYLTLSDNCEVQFKYDAYNVLESERVIRYDDPDIHLNIIKSDLIISEADKNAPLLKDSDVNFSLKDEK